MEKEILVFYGQRKRIVRFEGCDDLDLQRKRVYDEVRRTFEDVLSSAEGSSTSCSKEFFLQMENEVWGLMVDFTGAIEDRQTLHMITEEQGDVPALNSAVRLWL